MKVLLLFTGLACLLAPLLADWQEGPYYDPARTISMCGRNVTGYRNFLNSVFDVPLEWVGEVVLGDFFYIHKYRDLLLESKFKSLAEATDAGKMGQWTTVNSTWKERMTEQGREVYDNPFVKHATMSELQRAYYTSDRLLLIKINRNKDSLLSGFYIIVEYCVVPWGLNKTHVEVDALMIFENMLLTLIRGSIEKGASDGFVDVYGSLGLILQHLAANPGDRIPLDGAIAPLDETFFTGDVPTLSTDSESVDDATLKTDIPTPADAPSSFWKAKKGLYWKLPIAIVIAISLSAIFCYIGQKIKEMRRGERNIVAIYKANDDGFETVELDGHRETDPLRAHQ